MEINKISEKLNDLKCEKEVLKKLGREYEILGVYQGEDRVITSEQALEELKEDENRQVLKVKSTISALDKIVGDFREGQLVILSSPTGQGKTTFCQTLTYAFADQNINSVWFSYEVGIREFMEKMPDAPLFYLPRRIKQNSMDWLEARIKEGIAKYNCKIVFIDHLHYLLEMQKMAEAKSLSLLVGMMMRQLKRLAIENEIIIFLVSHMRKVRYDTNKLPDIDDLRDSSFVGQESDIVIFLQRVMEKGDEGQDIATNRALLKVAKNRRLGSLGYVKLTFNNNRFYEETDYQE